MSDEQHGLSNDQLLDGLRGMIGARTVDDRLWLLSRQGKAHFVPVTIGIAGKEHFEVLSGLKMGDSVVAGPYDAIRNLEENWRAHERRD